MSATRWVLFGTAVALLAVVLAPRSKTEGPFVPASLDEVVETVPLKPPALDSGVR